MESRRFSKGLGLASARLSYIRYLLLDSLEEKSYHKP